MKIQATPNYNLERPNKVNTTQTAALSSLPYDTVSFKGHSQFEASCKKGIELLIHQTAFFRDSATNEKVCDYIRKDLGHKKKIRIISGGCSTGEEGLTLRMMLDDINDKLEILGIDLGKKAIAQAQKGTYVIAAPKKGVSLLTYFRSISRSPYSDYYISSKDTLKMTPAEQRYKELFNEFFEPTGRKVKTPFWEKLGNLTLKLFGQKALELERTEYKLKNGKNTCCKFIQGDIFDLNKLTEGEKSDVIYFKNAMYHLTTETGDSGYRVPRKDSESIIKRLIGVFKENLNEDGLIVFGEDESHQMRDTETVPKVMRELGFSQPKINGRVSENIWKLDG